MGLAQAGRPRLRLNLSLTLLAALATLLFIDLFSLAALHCNVTSLWRAPRHELPSPSFFILFVAAYLLAHLALLPCFHDVSIGGLAYCWERSSADKRSGSAMPSLLDFLFRAYQRAVYRLTSDPLFEKRWQRSELVFRLACLSAAELVLAARGDRPVIQELVGWSLAVSLPLGSLVVGAALLLAARTAVFMLAEGKKLALEIRPAGAQREDWTVIACEGADRQ